MKFIVRPADHFKLDKSPCWLPAPQRLFHFPEGMVQFMVMEHLKTKEEASPDDVLEDFATTQAQLDAQGGDSPSGGSVLVR